MKTHLFCNYQKMFAGEKMLPEMEELRSLALKEHRGGSNGIFNQKLQFILSDSEKKNNILENLYENLGITKLVERGKLLIDKTKYDYFDNYINKKIKGNIEKNVEKILKFIYVREVDYYKTVVEEGLNLLEEFKEVSNKGNYIKIFNKQDVGVLQEGVSEFILMFYEKGEAFFEEYIEKKEKESREIKLQDINLDENAEVSDVVENLFNEMKKVNAHIKYKGKVLYTYRVDTKDDLLNQYEGKSWIDIHKLKLNLLSNLIK